MTASSRPPRQFAFKGSLIYMNYGSPLKEFLNPIRTEVFSHHISRGGGGGLFCLRFIFVCKPRIWKFGTQLKIGKLYHKQEFLT